MRKIIHLLIKLYMIFGILIPFKIGSVYFNTLIGILIVVFGGVYLFNKYKFKMPIIPKWIVIFNILTFIYCILILIQVFVVKNSVQFNIVKIVSILVADIIVNYYLFENDKLQEILKFSTNIFIISLICAIISYILGVQKIILKIPIEVISLEESISKYSESRLEWVLHHKSEMAVYCLFAILLFINYIKNNYIKVILTTMAIITVSLTKSKTALLLSIFMIFIILIINIINIIKNVMLKIASIFLGTVSIIISFIIFNNNIREFIVKAIEGRNISTLGYRTVIWGSAIETIKANLLGTGANFTASIIPNPYYEYQTYSNAHNFILQEMLESGIFGGTIYLLIIILFLFMIFKYSKNSFIILFTAIVVSQMDLAIYNVNKIIMFSIIPLCILNKYLINKKVEIKRENSIFNFST